MALLGIIRRWHLRDQVPLREIAKRLGISRNTVRRYLRSETTEPAYAERQSASAIDPYAFQLSGWLKTEAAKSRKQRRTLKQLHEDLTELGFKGSYDRVAAFARQWREGQTEWVNSARKRTRSGLTWAVQWIMATVDVVVYFSVAPPWTTAYRAAVEKNCAELTRRGKGFGTLFFGLAILAGFILSDLGIVRFISFTRGTMFAGPINEVPYMLRAQFLSRFGLVFYAWIIPLCTATYYWLFVSIVVNFRRYWRVGQNNSVEER